MTSLNLIKEVKKYNKFVWSNKEIFSQQTKTKKIIDLFYIETIDVKGGGSTRCGRGGTSRGRCARSSQRRSTADRS